MTNEGFNSRIAVCDEGCCTLETHYNALNEKYHQLSRVARDLFAELEHPTQDASDREASLRHYRTNLYILGVL